MVYVLVFRALVKDLQEALSAVHQTWYTDNADSGIWYTCIHEFWDSLTSQTRQEAKEIIFQTRLQGCQWKPISGQMDGGDSVKL